MRRPAPVKPRKTAKLKPKRKVLRGSYAVIGPATRSKILDAALKCILKFGYQGTSTLLVQRMAGVSRGSLLNEFPPKADLMVALSESIIKERSQAYVDTYRGVTDYRRR